MIKIKEIMDNMDKEDMLILKGFSYCLIAICLLIIASHL